MASFDWVVFCDRYRIDYKAAGKDHINIHCMWCGDADAGYHLAVSLSGKGYRCFRSPEQHKGKSTPKLVQALLGCSWPEAFSIAGESSRGPSLAESVFTSRAMALLNGSNKHNVDHKELEFPPEFRPLLPEGSGRYFLTYMAERGYLANDILLLHRIYKLQCTISGYFKYRIIFPIYIGKKLVSWTGRSISKTADIRYQTLSANPEVAERYDLPCAALSIEKTLWNYDNLLKGGNDLYICEGPFDAMRLDSVGYLDGIRATCVFKKQISEDQVSLLDNVVPRFDRTFLLFDTGEDADILRTRSQLAHLKLRFRSIPTRFEDPAAMDYQTAAKFLGVR